MKRLALGLAAAAAATSSLLVYASQDDLLGKGGFQVGSVREEYGDKNFKRDDTDVLVQRDVAERSYAQGTPGGGLREERAWEGYKIFKRADGSCYRVTHSNLRIENDSHGQHVHFEEQMTNEQCPRAFVLAPQPSAH